MPRTIRSALIGAAIILTPAAALASHDDMLGMAAAQTAPAAPQPVAIQVIHAGRLITDAATGTGGPATITVTDGRITAITQGHVPAPAGAMLIDLSTRTVMPGLIDMHVHLTGDPGGDFWREAVDPDEWGVIVGVKNAALSQSALASPPSAKRDRRGRPPSSSGAVPTRASSPVRVSWPPVRRCRLSAGMATSPAFVAR